MKAGRLSAVAATALPSLVAAQVPAATDWPVFGDHAGSFRFSPLDQITPANVARLWHGGTTCARPTCQSRTRRS